MKKFIVVVKPGINPNDETEKNLGEMAFAKQSFFKPLYDETNIEKSMMGLDDNPRLQKLIDEMSRTYTIEIDDEKEAEILSQLKDKIERLEEDEKNYGYFPPNDPFFSSLYGLKKMKVEAVWNTGILKICINPDLF